MARAESKMVMGYLPIEPHHHPAILSLVAPATSAVKLLDPFAGSAPLNLSRVSQLQVPGRDSGSLGLGQRTPATHAPAVCVAWVTFWTEYLCRRLASWCARDARRS